MTHHRVIVVGAGLAGLAAARRLVNAEIDAVVLEARDRVGGRTWSVPFEAAGLHVDLGAEWVSPKSHSAVLAELERYGLELQDPDADLVPSWHIGGRTELALEPLQGNEVDQFASALAALDRDAARIDFSMSNWHEAVLDLDIPFADYLDRLELHDTVRERVLIRSFALMGAPEDQYSALNMLHEIAGFTSADEAFHGDSRRIKGGTATVGRAIADELRSGIVRLSTPVRAIRQVDLTRVEVETDFETLSADAVIVAIPVNVLAGLDLQVPLPDAVRAAIVNGQAGQVAKVWTTATGLPDAYMSLGWPHVPEAYGLQGDRAFATVAFELMDAAGPGATEKRILETLSGRHPNASFSRTNTLWHDWVSDPYAAGTWQAARPGQAAAWYELAAMPGPCLFAGGDLSRRWVGWMDGALTSGHDAAGRALELLDAGKASAVGG